LPRYLCSVDKCSAEEKKKQN